MGSSGNDPVPVPWFACNKSIKRFYFDYFVELENVCSILTPLFKRNQAERIRIAHCNLSPERIGLLATSLAMFDSLKEFALTGARNYVTSQDDPESEQVVRELMQALSCHSRLRELDLASLVVLHWWTYSANQTSHLGFLISPTTI